MGAAADALAVGVEQNHLDAFDPVTLQGMGDLQAQPLDQVAGGKLADIAAGVRIAEHQGVIEQGAVADTQDRRARQARRERTRVAGARALRIIVLRVVSPGMLLSFGAGLTMLIAYWSELYAKAPWMHAKLTIGLIAAGFSGALSGQLRRASQSGALSTRGLALAGGPDAGAGFLPARPSSRPAARFPRYPIRRRNRRVRAGPAPGARARTSPGERDRGRG